jgi:hypothetical protein
LWVGLFLTASLDFVARAIRDSRSPAREEE